MSENINKTIQINNFNLNLFGTLLNQSLTVTPQLMLEFRDNIVKSCSFSSTKTLIKLWVLPINEFIAKPKIVESVELDAPINLTPQAPSFNLEENFNFYILKGDLFKKYVDVFNNQHNDSVKIEFTLKLIEDKYQATLLTIFGKSETGSDLKTTFALTTEELLSNKISDYAEVLKQCTPTDEMFEFLLNNLQIQEIKSLVRNLHKASTDNTAFLTFEITKDKIKISDKAFDLVFDIPMEYQTKNQMRNYKDDDCIAFNVLKSDFALIGNHSFSIFTEIASQKIIFGAKYNNSIIWCLATKIDTQKQIEDDSEFDSIDSLDVSEYIDIDGY